MPPTNALSLIVIESKVSILKKDLPGKERDDEAIPKESWYQNDHVGHRKDKVFLARRWWKGEPVLRSVI